MSYDSVPWPHAPTHQLSESGTFFVTARTYNTLHHFRGADRLEVLHHGLLKLARDYSWRLEAWAVFSDHYHFVGHSPESEENAESLRSMLGDLHSATANFVNELDGVCGRKVWHNYRETALTYQRSYMARLSYVHQNAVKHGLVKEPSDYPWCSAGWFERMAPLAMVRSVYRFRTGQVNVEDDFEVCGEW